MVYTFCQLQKTETVKFKLNALSDTVCVSVTHVFADIDQGIRSDRVKFVIEKKVRF